jgi:hypothetical protein
MASSAVGATAAELVVRRGGCADGGIAEWAEPAVWVSAGPNWTWIVAAAEVRIASDIAAVEAGALEPGRLQAVSKRRGIKATLSKIR